MSYEKLPQWHTCHILTLNTIFTVLFVFINVTSSKLCCISKAVTKHQQKIYWELDVLLIVINITSACLLILQLEYIVLANCVHYWVWSTLNMIFKVTMLTFWMTLRMNKWTNLVMDDGWAIGQNANFTCQQHMMKYCHGYWYLDEKSLGKWQ